MSIVDTELQKILAWPQRFDLHTHSHCSDGKYSPKELVAYARSKKVDILALTDHDTCNGLDDAILAGKENDIHIVTGIEISTLWHSNQIHIVGLCIDHHHPKMEEFIRMQYVKREERAKEIGRKLEKCGFHNAYEETKAMAGDGACITRGNYAAFLYEKGAALTMDRCFAQYLAEGCIGYVKPKWEDIPTAVKVIKDTGGIAVIAHPGRYKMNNKWLRRLIVDFKECGGEAMEVSGTMQQPAERDFLANLSSEYGLYASCGTDFHREKSYVDLGCNLVIPEKATPIWCHPKFKLEV